MNTELHHAAGDHFKNRPLAGLMIDSGAASGALSDDRLRSIVPSAFAEGRHESRSERYAYIPTINVIQALRSEGFLPVAAAQGKCRIPGKSEFTKHLIRFRREMDIDSRESRGVAETVLVNSHDGTSSYWILEGAFRAACKNGLIVATGDVNGFKVSHSGKVVDRVIEGSYRVIDSATKAIEQTREWARIDLNPSEQFAFAKSAAQLRYDPETQIVAPEAIIRVRRPEDLGNDLWTTFNRAQEALIRGGTRYMSRHTDEETGRTSIRDQESRPVKSIDGNVGINRALWTLAAEMAKLKA